MSTQRIRVANAESPHPILWLGLDGVDEVGRSHAEGIRRLLHHFAREELRLKRTGDKPSISLVVTCRGMAPFERLLPMSRTEPRPLEDAYHRVSLLGFGRDELLNASALITPAVLNRLRTGFAVSEDEIGGMTSPGMLINARSAMPAPFGGASRSPARAPDPRVLRSLEHPPMWRGFVDLTEAEQHRALDGDENVLASLGRRFVRWFLHKAVLRSEEWRIIESNLPTLLIAAARATASSSEMSHRRLEDWIIPLRNTGLISDTSALAFLHEAASAGVVEEAGSVWNWRHAFLPRALITGEPESFSPVERAR